MRPEFKRQTILATIATISLSLTIWYSGAPGWLAYLLSINSVCFAFYGWDKWRAIKQKSRTPEGVLHFSALEEAYWEHGWGKKHFVIKRSNVPSGGSSGLSHFYKC